MSVTSTLTSKERALLLGNQTNYYKTHITKIIEVLLIELHFKLVYERFSTPLANSSQITSAMPVNFYQYLFVQLLHCEITVSCSAYRHQST